MTVDPYQDMASQVAIEVDKLVHLSDDDAVTYIPRLIDTWASEGHGIKCAALLDAVASHAHWMSAKVLVTVLVATVTPAYRKMLGVSREAFRENVRPALEDKFGRQQATEVLSQLA